MVIAIKNVASFLQNRVLGNLVLTFGTSTALQVMSILTGIITARMLGPAGKGQLTAVVVWVGMLAMLGSLGIVEAINYYTASRKTGQGSVLATGIVIGLCQSILLLAAGWVLTPLVLEEQGPALIQLGRYFLILIPLNLFTLYLQGYLGGRLHFSTYNFIRFAVSITILGGLVFLLVVDRVSVGSVLLVYLIANAITLLVALMSVLRAPSDGYIPSRKLAASMLAYGVKAHTSNVTATFNERFDQLIIAMFLPAAQLGFYAIGVSLTTGVMIIGTSIAIVALPVVARLEDTEERARSVSRFFRVNFWFSVVIAIALILITPYLILILFGAAYLPAETATRILLLAAIPLSGNRVLQAALKSSNLPLHAGLAELIAAIATIIFLIALLPIYGIVGAAITSFLAYIISGVYMLWFVKQKVGCKLADLFIPKAQDFSYVSRLIKAPRTI
jgi:O-antigen/teichoic acid export membrane protein